MSSENNSVERAGDSEQNSEIKQAIEKIKAVRCFVWRPHYNIMVCECENCKATNILNDVLALLEKSKAELDRLKANLAGEKICYEGRAKVARELAPSLKSSLPKQIKNLCNQWLKQNKK
jgi:uncharacterized protein YejL (UPF0352 family)